MAWKVEQPNIANQTLLKIGFCDVKIQDRASL